MKQHLQKFFSARKPETEKKPTASVRYSAEGEIATRLAHSSFLRESFYTQRKVINWLVVAVLIQSSVIVGLLFKGDSYRYFATDTSGRIQELTPIDQPIHTTDIVLEWTQRAYVKAHSFDFANIKEDFQEMREHFTPEGWVSWQNALNEGGNIERVLQNKMISTAVLTGAPTIYQEGSVGGIYRWLVDMPLLVTYQSSGQLINQTIKARVLVIRVSQAVSPYGLAIQQIRERVK